MPVSIDEVVGEVNDAQEQPSGDEPAPQAPHAPEVEQHKMRKRMHDMHRRDHRLKAD